MPYKAKRKESTKARRFPMKLFGFAFLSSWSYSEITTTLRIHTTTASNFLILNGFFKVNIDIRYTKIIVAWFKITLDDIEVFW